MPFSPILLRAVATASIALAAAALARSGAAAQPLLLVEADSGRVLKAEQATHPWYPASVTKLMTAYVTLRAVKEGRLKLDSLLTVSANAVAQQPVKMGFKAGTQLTVDNALKMLMVRSANDIAVVLAEGVSGSVEKFAGEMNRAAQRLGMRQTNYVNPNGLPAEGQVTSARDLAILARALIREFPEHDLYWRISAIKLGKRVLRNYNWLIDRYAGADGMKTGFICASGFNLVATASRGGRRLIAVVLGAPSSAVRAAKAAQMLESGFNGGGLSWLLPSLGAVENLTPVDAEPPNLREEMCGKHRRRPAAETDDVEETVPATNEEPGGQHAFMLSSLRAPAPKPATLLGELNPSSPPVEVYVGPARRPPGGALAVNGGKPAGAKAGAPPDAAGTPAIANVGLLRPARAQVVPTPRPRPALTRPKPALAGVKPGRE